MKQNTWFDYHFGGWLWLIRYKIANFIIGYNIEDALEEHMAHGWDEGYLASCESPLSFDFRVSPYRQGENSD